MANWQTAVVTDKGKALIAKVTAGTTQLNITRAAIGRGNPSNLVQATALANAIGAAEIITKVAKNNTTTVAVRITNAAFSQLESISELGLFATDPDEGEILFCVMVDSNPDQVQAASNSTLVAKTITMGIGYDNADNVTVVLSNTAWVTAEEVLAMITDELRKYGNNTHKIVDSTVALNSAQTMTALTDMLGNRLKAITGETSWVTDPADTIKNMRGTLAALAALVANLPTSNIADFNAAVTQILNGNVVSALQITYRLETNGFIKFGALGGFTIQWGTATVTTGTNYTNNVSEGEVVFTFPTAFTSEPWAVFTGLKDNCSTILEHASVGSKTSTNVRLYLHAWGATNVQLSSFVFAIGT